MEIIKTDLPWPKRLRGSVRKVCKGCDKVVDAERHPYWVCSECGHCHHGPRIGGITLEQRVYGSDSNPVYSEQLGEYTMGKSDFMEKCRAKGLAPI